MTCGRRAEDFIGAPAMSQRSFSLTCAAHAARKSEANLWEKATFHAPEVLLGAVQTILSLLGQEGWSVALDLIIVVFNTHQFYIIFK